MSATAHNMKKGKLWVRNGLSGLTAEKDGVEIDIEEDLLMNLMADEMRNRLIGRLEQMDTDDIFKYFGIAR